MPHVMDRQQTAERTAEGHGGFASFAWGLVVGLAAVAGAFALGAANHEGAAVAVLVAGVVAALAPVARNRRGGVDGKGLAGAFGGLVVVAMVVAGAIAWFLYTWTQASE